MISQIVVAQAQALSAARTTLATMQANPQSKTPFDQSVITAIENLIEALVPLIAQEST